MITLRDVEVRYGARRRLHVPALTLPSRRISAIVGPAGAGKTTLLRALNRTLELTPGARLSGQVVVDDIDVYATDTDVLALRRRVGMVQPLPVGLPMSIYDNVAFGPRLAGVAAREALDPLVERALRLASLWDEVHDRLGQLGTKLSGGQQQRLTLARALATRPSVLCLDEFSIAIDPITTAHIEETLHALAHETTIIVVTNELAQARRLSSHLALLVDGQLVEDGPTAQVTSDPREALTRRYVAGEIG